VLNYSRITSIIMLPARRLCQAKQVWPIVLPACVRASATHS